MIISENQLLLLIQVLQDSLPVVNNFSLAQKSRIELWENILKQQPRDLKEVE